MGFPTLTVEVALTTDPGDTPSWTDISGYLEEIVVGRGRSQESESFRAGTLQILLANEDRRFDPTQTAGPYYPNLLPMRRVRVRATYSAVTYDVFNGYVDGWEQIYAHPQVARCRLTATDAFKVLGNTQLPSSAYAYEVQLDGPAAWYRLGEPADPDVVRDSAGSNHLGMTEPPTFGVAGLTVRDSDTAMTVSATEQGATRIGAPTVPGPPMTFEMIYRGPTTAGVSLYGEVMDNPSGGVPQVYGWAFDFDGSGHPQFTGLTSAAFGTVTAAADVDDEDPHHLAATWASDGTVKVYVDGAESGSGSITAGTFPASVYVVLGGGQGGSTAGVAAIGTYDEVAIYDTVLTPARILAHADARAVAWAGEHSGARIGRILDAAGWPAADRDIDPGAALLQGADLGTTALAALQKIEETERGRLFVTADGKVRFIDRDALIQAPYTTSQATFGDSGSELEYADLKYRYDDQTIVNEVVVARSGGVPQTVSDTASQDKYLRRSLVLDGLIHQDDSTSLDLANWMLAHYSEPVMRATQVRLEPDAGNETTHFPQVLGRELAERITVRRRPQSVGSAIDQETWIENVEHRVANGLHWSSAWNLSPAETDVYGVWDDAGSLWDQAKWGF